MEQSKEYTVNIKDCVKYIVSKWKVLLLVTSIFALLAAGVAAFHYIRQIETVDALQKEIMRLIHRIMRRLTQKQQKHLKT